MPPRGFLYVKYYSGEGKGINGTHPNIAVRKSLLNLVGINEDELLTDESNQILGIKNIETENGTRSVTRVVGLIYSELEGMKCAEDHKTLWEVFLTPFSSTSARIAKGEKVLSVFDDIKNQTGKDPYNLHVVSVPKQKKDFDFADLTGKRDVATVVMDRKQKAPAKRLTML